MLVFCRKMHSQVDHLAMTMVHANFKILLLTDDHEWGLKIQKLVTWFMDDPIPPNNHMEHHLI